MRQPIARVEHLIVGLEPRVGYKAVNFVQLFYPTNDDDEKNIRSYHSNAPSAVGVCLFQDKGGGVWTKYRRGIGNLWELQ